MDALGGLESEIKGIHPASVSDKLLLPDDPHPPDNLTRKLRFSGLLVL